MEFSEITISDKELFDRYIREYEPQASELTFTNFFMWRHFYKFRFAELEGYLCTIAVPDEGKPYAMAPIGLMDNGDYEAAVMKLKEYFDKRGWELVFRRVEERQLRKFSEMGKLKTEAVLDRDNSDYVYLSSDLINLKGKKYDGKRNHINKFKKLYEYEYVEYNENLRDEVARILEEWCISRDCGCQKGEYCERHVDLELLDNYGRLDCKGALIKVNGRFEAFTAGEYLNGDTVVVHVEKANSNLQGLYTIVNQQFCEHEWKAAQYINREQDMGIEGLRKAKLSYHPAKMIDKYIVKII